MFSIVTLKKILLQGELKLLSYSKSAEAETSILRLCLLSVSMLNFVKASDWVVLQISSFVPCRSQCTSINFKLHIWNKTWWNLSNYLSFVCTLWYIQGIFRCIVFSIMSVKRSASLVAFKSFEPLNFPLMFALVSLSTSFIGHWRVPETVTLL